jgi:anthranilate phosphoribosyltransferase
VIQDSGERREFPTGAVRDIQEGKGRYDLIPWEAIHELALHCEHGALKYGERNINKGIPVHSLIDSALRHISCYLRGMQDEPHLRAALWNIAFAIWTEQKRPDLQDIPERMEG